MRQSFVRRSLTPLIGLLLLTLTGCGGDRFGALTGKVTYKGKPLPAGVVTFHYPDGRVETTQIQPDGTYFASRVLVGDVKIAVLTPHVGRLPPALAKAMKEGDEQSIAAARRDGATIVPSVPIPARYNEPGTSGLSVQIHEGEQVYDIVLKP